MDEYLDEVRHCMRQLNDSELLARATSGTLTEKAQDAANEELTSRGLQLPQERIVRPISNHHSRSLATSLHLAYAGQLELWRVFWIGILGPLLAMLVADAIFSENGAMSEIALWVYLITYWAWAYCVWKCSENVDTKLLGWLAGRLAGAVLITVPLIAAISITRAIVSTIG